MKQSAKNGNTNLFHVAHERSCLEPQIPVSYIYLVFDKVNEISLSQQLKKNISRLWQRKL